VIITARQSLLTGEALTVIAAVATQNLLYLSTVMRRIRVYKALKHAQVRVV
jgi:hypothetical protein